MSIELTDQQQHALDALGEDPARLVDPRTNAAYVLLPVELYESIREILEDDKQQKAIRSVGLRNAVGRMNEEVGLRSDFKTASRRTAGLVP
ncbi:MAG TPA: hypothetical protein DDY78_19300 [Planctomycetales bacterium]|jgi:hypothetical protein|nr:hypothetical protein [Planctomycetales bacterium]